MNFKDKWVTDENGKEFIFTVEMQRQLSQAGLPVEPASLKAQEKLPGRREPETAEAEPERRQEQEIVGPATIQIDPQTGKYIGRVKWYNAKKGYGFIVRGAGEEIFFHKTGSVGDPTEMDEGQWVLYDVEETRKGPEATDVEPYEGDVSQLA